jgi:hypothetical protein
MRAASAPIRRKGDGAFGKMYAVCSRSRRQRRVIGNDPFQSAFACETRKQTGEFCPARAAPRAQYHEAVAGQHVDGCKRIGQALVVGHENQSRQCGQRLSIEPHRRPCQLCACERIRHAMSPPDHPAEAQSAQNLAGILARIEAARKAALAPAPPTTLVAISKTFGPERIVPVLAAGHRIFGENRVQEARTKWPALKSEWPDVELHLVGPLQTNKVREAVALFDAIHSVDRPSLAEALRAEIDSSARAPLLFIQVNTGEEPQKAGVLPQDASAFIGLCRDRLSLPIFGVMCIPPLDEPPAPHFALLAKLARAHGLSGLSMGMSADFETAIRFGATHVRVGTAIFGDRC